MFIRDRAFAVGLRVQHPQVLINRSQYGMEECGELGPASYKVTKQTAGGRGVYSFCMCPGGYVVNACLLYTSFPMLHRERAETGRRRRGWYLKAGRWSFTCLLPVRGQGEWDYAMEEQQLRLFSNFYLPVYIGDIRGKEMVSYESNYTKEELEHISKAINYQFCLLYTSRCV